MPGSALGMGASAVEKKKSGEVNKLSENKTVSDVDRTCSGRRLNNGV